jgi:EpsI family protein
MRFLKGAPAVVLTFTLGAQTAAYYAVASRSEVVPNVAPLKTFPQSAAGWNTVREFPLEKEVQDVLRADDSLNRVYVNSSQTASASLFVAFFRTQRFGQSPHSPKNCLPGSGWEPTEDRKLPITVPGRAEPITVNEYVIQHGEEQSVVLYWYQSHNRVIAGEVAAKFWLVLDAIRFRRSDTSLVRVIVPVREGSIDVAKNTAVEFARAVYPDVVRQLP